MLPITLNSNQVRIVVFGYGKASQTKIQGIARSGMRCHVVSPSIEEASVYENITLECASYTPDQLSKGQLVIAATDSEALNAQIMLDAHAAGKLVLNLSNGDKSDFHMMSWRRKGPVTLGMSTGNCAPKESVRLIESLIDVVDDETVCRIQYLGALRKKIKQLGIRPVKPLINKMTALTVEELARLEALPLEELALEIKKDM